MDQIRIVDLEVFANHGAYPEENVLGQKFLVSVTLHTDLSRAGTTDCLGDSVDYGAVCRLIDATMRENTFSLIERAAEEIAQRILAAYSSIGTVDVELKKPWAPIGLPLAYVSIAISRDRKGAASR